MAHGNRALLSVHLSYVYTSLSSDSVMSKKDTNHPTKWMKPHHHRRALFCAGSPAIDDVADLLDARDLADGWQVPQTCGPQRPLLKLAHRSSNCIGQSLCWRGKQVAGPRANANGMAHNIGSVFLFQQNNHSCGEREKLSDNACENSHGPKMSTRVVQSWRKFLGKRWQSWATSASMVLLSNSVSCSTSPTMIVQAAHGVPPLSPAEKRGKSIGIRAAAKLQQARKSNTVQTRAAMLEFGFQALDQVLARCPQVGVPLIKIPPH